MGRELIFAFIEGKGTDHLSRTIHEIWRFNDHEIENTHDYIQWLFPLDEKSKAVPQSPVLTQDEISSLRVSAASQANLKKSTMWFKEYLGRTKVWHRARDHNHLRVSRVIKCLNLLVSQEDSLGFFRTVMKMSKPCESKMIGVRQYWTSLILDLTKNQKTPQKSP